MKVALIALALGYAAGAIWTFGYVWNRTECEEDRVLFISCGEQKAAPALISMILWPLAISVILQEREVGSK